MSLSYTLTNFTFLNGVTASAVSPVFRCDWRFAGSQERRFTVQPATNAGTARLEHNHDYDVTAASVWALVTSVSVTAGVPTTFQTDSAFRNLRINYVGAAGGGACTVLGLV